MNGSEVTLDPERVRKLVLARLLVQTKKPLSRSAAMSAVARCMSPPLSRQAADAMVATVLEACERAGWVSGIRPALTKKARAELPAVFGAKALPSLKTWARAQQWVALSTVGQAGRARLSLEVDELAAVVLSARHGLPASESSLAAVVDRLAWRALGVETGARFEVEKVQRFLLRDIVPEDARVKKEVWRRLLAVRAVGATRSDARAISHALLWHVPTQGAAVTRSAAPTVLAVNDNDSAAQPQPSLADFAAAVVRAARSPEVTRFHDDRAFIGSIWENMHGHGPVGDMSLAAFKEQLIAAHRQRLLRITRADLVSAMDPNEVSRSEARYEQATFHFVALDAGGAR